VSELGDKLKNLVDNAERAWADLSGIIESIKDCLDELGVTKPKDDEDGEETEGQGTDRKSE